MRILDALLRLEIFYPETLKIKLLTEFQARKGKESMQNQQNAFHANNNKTKFKGEHRTNEGSKTTTEKEVKPFKCHYCHKREHKISQCWKKKNKEATCAF